MISHLLLKSKIKGYLTVIAQNDLITELAALEVAELNFGLRLEIMVFFFNTKEIQEIPKQYSDSSSLRSNLLPISKISIIQTIAIFLEHYFNITISKEIRKTYQEISHGGMNTERYLVIMYFIPRSEIKYGKYLLWNNHQFANCQPGAGNLIQITGVNLPFLPHFPDIIVLRNKIILKEEITRFF